jgi:tRNA/tmRNA/rRNA uracil-C5-methylase (TrmA/RlmC/RlmD family)
VNAYCGDGLFALALVLHFRRVAGIGLSADSIRFATDNAALNSLAHTDFQCHRRVSSYVHGARCRSAALGVRRQGIRVAATRLSRAGGRVRSHNVHTQAWDV